MLCECGCGREVKEGNRFIHGHHRRSIKLSDKTKKKMSKAQKGRKRSEETKKKMSEAKRGRVGKKHTDETKKKCSEASKGNQNMLGHKHTDEAKKKMSGENAANWQGGVSFGKYCPKFNGTVKEEVREKYGRKCIICDKTEDDNGRKLDVHHIDYNKLQGCEEHEWKLVPLCISCHSKTSNGDRDYWERSIIENLEGLN